VFPFYARSRHPGQFEKRTILWPVWTHARFTHPKAAGSAWVLFPLAGRVNLSSQKGWMVLPPLFQFIRGDELTRTYCPWPFFQRETGMRTRLILWPFYGHRIDGNLDRRYALWPIIVRERNNLGRRKYIRWGVVPFWSSITYSTADAGTPREITARRTKLWPLFTWQADGIREMRRLRVLDLWPGPEAPPVARSWAPLWTLLDWRTHGENSDFDLLWGLIRRTRRAGGGRAVSVFPLWQHERAPRDEARRWSVLKGLLAWDRTAERRQLRFLWLGRIRLSGKGAEAATP